MSGDGLSKEQIRREISAWRRVLTADQVEVASARIQVEVLRAEPMRRGHVVACYLALPYEVQTQKLLEACWAAGKRVCVPAYDNAQDRYRWSFLGADAAVRAGLWNVPEPTHAVWADEHEWMDVMVVPGTAFDACGHRLGHGLGWYDRLMAGSSAFKIGVAFEVQMVPCVPMKPHDVAVDLVVTERAVYPADPDSRVMINQ